MRRPAKRPRPGAVPCAEASRPYCTMVTVIMFSFCHSARSFERHRTHVFDTQVVFSAACHTMVSEKGVRVHARSARAVFPVPGGSSEPGSVRASRHLP